MAPNYEPRISSVHLYDINYISQYFLKAQRYINGIKNILLFNISKIENFWFITIFFNNWLIKTLSQMNVLNQMCVITARAVRTHLAHFFVLVKPGIARPLPGGIPLSINSHAVGIWNFKYNIYDSKLAFCKLNFAEKHKREFS